MGSWSATCAISNLPINCGDEVFAFIIEGKHSGLLRGLGYSKSDDVYKPVTFAYYGKYVDSGRLDSYECVIGNKMDNFIFERAICKYECCDKEFISKELSFNNIKKIELFDLISKGCVTYRGVKDEKRPVGLVYIKKSVLDVLVDDLIEDDSYKIESLKNRLNLYVEDFFEQKKEVMDFEPDHKKAESLFKCRRMWNSFGNSSVLLDCIEDLLIEGKISLDIVKKNILFLGYIDIIMNRLRKSWIPQVGVGSQEYVNSTYLALAKTVTYECEKEKED